MSKDDVKKKMDEHTTDADRFKAFVNGVLDEATHLVNSNASQSEMLGAIAGFRNELDEAWADITKHSHVAKQAKPEDKKKK